MRETLLLLQENGNLREILGICQVPSPASVSRLSRVVEEVVRPEPCMNGWYEAYSEGLDRMVGHLSIDSTIIPAREKPVHKERGKGEEASTPLLAVRNSMFLELP
jgi:hypothetical protein